ncbi:hypothetical protein LINPERPRIM_LOCUS12937 [Linum perenne]
MGMIKLRERRVSPEITVEPAAGDSADMESSKDETYLDSRAWLGSDSEDDYYSVKEYTPSSVASSPMRRRIPIKNIYYNNTILERRRINVIPQPTTPPSAMAERGQRNQKPLVELLKDPYWNEQIEEVNSRKIMRLVEFLLEDSLWEKQLSLSFAEVSPPPAKHGAAAAASSSPPVAVGSGKARSKRVQNDEPRVDGCCFPRFGTRFWCKKRKTKAAAVS